MWGGGGGGGKRVFCFYLLTFSTSPQSSSIIPSSHPHHHHHHPLLQGDSTFTSDLLSGHHRDAGDSSQVSHHACLAELPAQRRQPPKSAQRTHHAQSAHSPQFTQHASRCDHTQPAQGDVAARGRYNVNRIPGSSEAAAGLLLCVGPSDTRR